VPTYPGANIESDHNSLTEIPKFRGKRITNKSKRKTYDISSLSYTGKREMLKDELLNKYIKLDNNNEDKNIKDQSWRIIKNSIHNAIEEILEYSKRKYLEKNE